MIALGGTATISLSVAAAAASADVVLIPAATSADDGMLPDASVEPSKASAVVLVLERVLIVTLLTGPFEECSMLGAEGEGELVRQVPPIGFLPGDSGSGVGFRNSESIKASSDGSSLLMPESNRGRFLSCCEPEASRESLRVLEDSVIEP